MHPEWRAVAIFPACIHYGKNVAKFRLVGRDRFWIMMPIGVVMPGWNDFGASSIFR